MTRCLITSILTSACRVIYDNVNAGQSRQERFKRAVKCLVVFGAVFLFFNSYILRGHFKIWRENPGGATLWLILSFMLSLWMSMWTSQCTVLMDEDDNDDRRRQYIHHRRRNMRSSVVPLPQELIELETMKQEALINCPKTTFHNTILSSNGRIVSNNDDDLCSVCLSNFDRETLVRETQCHHIYCSDCFETFVEVCNNRSGLICPMCRHPLSTTTTPVVEQNHDNNININRIDIEEQQQPSAIEAQEPETYESGNELTLRRLSLEVSEDDDVYTTELQNIAEVGQRTL